jgi:hypothetical protein
MVRAFFEALAATFSLAAQAEDPKSLNVKLVCDRGTETEVRLTHRQWNTSDLLETLESKFPRAWCLPLWTGRS